MRYAYLVAIVLAVLVVFPTVSAACDVSDSFNYSYTNTGDRTDRVTFVLLNKTSADMDVVFEPSVLIVIPDETKTFTVHASASDSLEGIQSAGFAIRAGNDIVAQATALFDLSCVDGEGNGSEPEADRSTNFAIAVLGYSLLVLIVCLLILWGVVALLDSRDEPRERRVRENRSVGSDSERRAPINVDAMIRAEREHEDHTPWWLWLLIVLVVLIIVGAFIYLLVSGADVTGFNYGAGINITNLTNATNASA